MSATRSLLIAAALLIVAVAAALGYVFTREADTPEPAPSVSQSESEAEAPSESTALAPPSFDVVRVDPRGTAVVAGRGSPGARVSLLAGDREVAEAEIDGAGEWVMIIEDPLPAGSVELSLLMRTPSGQEIRSDQVVVVSIPESRDRTPLVVLGRPGGASEVLQSPFDGISMGSLSLETVDYDDAGAVIFSGRSAPGAGIRVLANGDVVGETTADAAGRWTVQADETFAPGVYNLQIDQIEDGQVTAVIVLPFERVSAEELNMGDNRVVVQPGNSLWRIARRLYGEGVQYTVIYEANQSQIRDPDLIYPGQVLDVPGEEGRDSEG